MQKEHCQTLASKLKMVSTRRSGECDWCLLASPLLTTSLDASEFHSFRTVTHTHMFV